MKKLLLLLVVIALIVCPSTAWLSGYSNRISHAVNGSSSMSGDAHNISIPYWLHNGTGTSNGSTGYLPGVLYSDWKDIQPTDSNDKPIPFYIEIYEPERAKVWVKYPTITDGGSDTIYFYWGNQYATKNTDGEAAFFFYDNFEGYLIDVWKWDATNASLENGVVNVSLGSLQRRTYTGTIHTTLEDLQYEIGIRLYGSFPSPTTAGTPAYQFGLAGGSGDAYLANNVTHSRIQYYQTPPALIRNITDVGETGWMWHDLLRYRAGTLKVLVNDDTRLSLTSSGTNESLGWGLFNNVEDPSYLDYIFIYNTTSYDVTHSTWGSVEESTASSGAGIQYPPHSVQFIVTDKGGNKLSGINITAVPTSTSMGSWTWIQSLFGIGTDVELNSTPMYSITGSTGTSSFVMSESINYHITAINATQGVNNSWDIYPKDDTYIFIVDTTAIPATNVPLSSVIDWNLYDSGNDTYTTMILNYTDTSALTPFVLWTVTNSSGTVLETQNLTPSGGVTNETYGVTLGLDDEEWIYGFSAYSSTYGWINNTAVVVSHKDVSMGGLTGYWKDFAAFGLICVVGLLFSRKNWQTGFFVTVVFAIALAQMHWFELNNSYSSTMTVLVALLALSILVLMRGTGEGGL